MKVLSPARLKLVFVWLTLIAVLIGLLPPNASAQQQPFPGDPPKEAAVAYSRGIEAYDKGDYAKAILNFSIAIFLYPKYGDAYYHRALVIDEIPWLKEIQSTVSDYTAAITFNPLNADAYLRRGLRLRGADAIKDFSSAILIRPNFAEAYHRRGVARSESSIYWLRRIQAGGLKEVDLPIYSTQIGTDSRKMAEVVAYLTNEIRSAIPDLTKSTELNTAYVEAYLYQAALYSVLGEHNKAVAASTNVLAIKPDNADAYHARGIAYLRLKQYEKANQDFTEVIRLRPEQTRAYTKRVIARFNLKDFDGALKDYVTVLRSKPDELSRRDDYEDDMGGTPAIEPENFDRIAPKLAKTVRSSLADAYYQRALTIRYSWRPREEEQKKAVADLSRASILDPSHVAAHYEKGLTLLDLELHAAAMKAFGEVIRLQPQNSEAYYARGVALHELRLNRRALHDLSRSIQLSPKFTKAYFERGRAYAALGDQRRAVADFTSAIAIHSEFVEAYYRRAQAYETLGENQKAIADYIHVAHLAFPGEKIEGEQTERLGPSLATVFHRGVARLNLALLIDKNDGYGFRSGAEEFAKKDYLEAAEKDLTHVINAKPEFPNAYRERGRARAIERVSKYFKSGGANYSVDIEAALADFTKAIELNPRYIDAYFSRADQFDSMYKPEEAIRDYKRIVELDPANALAFYRLGRSYERNTEKKPADPKAALENYSLAIKADPGYVIAYFSRAYLLRKKEPQQALADYTRIIQLDPENAGAYRRRAAVYLQLKDDRSALADYTRAIELDPSEPGSDDWDAAHTFADRAYVRFEFGDGKGAVEDYRQALLIRPCLNCVSGSTSVSQANKADAFLQKGLALLRRGDKQESRKNLEEAARLFYTQGDMPKYQNVKYHLSRF